MKKKPEYKKNKFRRGKPPNFSGQHLMHNKKLLHEIVNKVDIKRNETILELGAGKGALTTILNQKSNKVLAVEYDAKFVQTLRRKTASDPNTKIIHQDIMKIRLPKEPFVVVSNIPYAITTPIMRMLLSHPSTGFQRGVIIMEKGAAKRFTSKWMKNAYVLIWRMWFDIHYIKEIPRTNFSPPPKVDSAMILIRRKKEPLLSNKDYKAFAGLAEYVMNYPKARVEDVLWGIFTPPQMKQLKRNLKLNNEATINSLTEEQWGIIYKTMVQYVQRPYWPRAKRR
ncbi:23S ribosomal RNA methyltransferase Erm [Pseudalkalibacillus sp. A8]|uniref:23S ribosomal RNA methyltransferase Erm n=1 Tax=Pseudalkalibacillus sp. A8 TaxID=3382641 RepID=UPI0038B47382